MRPAFRIRADERDVTETIRRRLVRLSISDEKGTRSDSFELVLDDRPPHLALPRRGADLDVALGFKGAMWPMGKFVADELEISTSPAQLTIRGRATNLSGIATQGGRSPGLKVQRRRSWHATTLGQVLTDIGSAAGHAVQVAADVASEVVEHLDQVDEGDAGLLVRLAETYDLAVKVAGGALVALRRQAGRSASGAPIPPITILPADTTTCNVVMPQRRAYSKVVARWHDLEAGAEREATAGDGSPALTLKRQYPSEAEARSAAAATLRRLERRRGELKLTLAVGDPRIVVETRIEMVGWRDGIAGAWVASQVEHRLDEGGLTSTLTCEAG